LTPVPPFLRGVRGDLIGSIIFWIWYYVKSIADTYTFLTKLLKQQGRSTEAQAVLALLDRIPPNNADGIPHQKKELSPNPANPIGLIPIDRRAWPTNLVSSAKSSRKILVN
jgi:hypothetical protein